MPASVKTMQVVYGVLQKHLDGKLITKLLDDLEEVRGNQSFRTTVLMLSALHRDAERKKRNKVETGE